MRKQEVIDLAKNEPELFQIAVDMERNAREAGTLKVVKGLGRHWSWETLVQEHGNANNFFDDMPPMCDVCVDW